MSVEIKTERLNLRPFRPSDADDVARLLNNLNVARWLTRVPYPYAAKDALSYFDYATASGFTNCAVCDEDGLVGCVSIQETLGYWYGEPFWGRGYATEAARALVDYHFASGSELLLSGYHLGNDGSQNVLKKLGFVPTTIHTAQSQSLGVEVKTQGMELTKTRWEGMQ
jgi:RimJ/RimL family protein N-acetyltransferase